VPHRLYPSFRSAIDGLTGKTVDAVMFNEEILRYYSARAAGAKLEVLPQIFMVENFAFPLGDESPLRVPLNQALRRALAGTHYRDLKDQYLAGGESAPTDR
jgi:ABC-type amino acid transport substrate-binding protein